MTNESINNSTNVIQEQPIIQFSNVPLNNEQQTTNIYPSLPAVRHLTYQPIITYSDMKKSYLKENFPACFVVFHSVFMIMLALAMIGIQVFFIYKETYLCELGAGFVSGSSLLLTTLITIITSTTKKIKI